MRQIVRFPQFVIDAERIALHLANESVESALRFLDSVEASVELVGRSPYVIIYFACGISQVLASVELVGRSPYVGGRVMPETPQTKGWRVMTVRRFRNFLIYSWKTGSSLYASSTALEINLPHWRKMRPQSSFSLLLDTSRCRLDRQPQPHRLRHGHERREPGVPAGGECPIEAFPLQARRLGHFRDTPLRLGKSSQSDQQHLWFVGVLKRCFKVLGCELRIVAKFLDQGFVM